MRSVLAEVGLALAGRAGARLADGFGAKVSQNTVLRLVAALPEPQPHVPRVVGVDEYAMRKGRVYGTALVDDETSRPVDLLPYCEAGTVAAWLTEHPSIEVVCRARAPYFAEGARNGAPTPVQVADRIHLWRNLGEAAERRVSRHRACLRATSGESAPENTPAPELAESGAGGARPGGAGRAGARLAGWLAGWLPSGASVRDGRVGVGRWRAEVALPVIATRASPLGVPPRWVGWRLR